MRENSAVTSLRNACALQQMRPLLQSVGKLLRLSGGPQLLLCRVQPAWHSSA